MCEFVTVHASRFRKEIQAVVTYVIFPPSCVLRRARVEGMSSIPGAEPLPTLLADYWIERPDGRGAVHLAFATPMLLLREPMLELFDTITAALRWVEAAPRA